MEKGKIYVVGMGPGNKDNMSFKAFDSMKKSDILIGHKTYISLVEDMFPEKELIRSAMKKEIDRCNETLKLAESGKTISLISSGESGVYGMAGIMLEVALDSDIEVEIVPGITASNAGASVVGAPIMHDHATISLSDLLTDWKLITKRIDLASQGDFVISYYNPKSFSRTTQIVEAREIMLRHKRKDTPVAIVRNAKRDGEDYVITTLEDMLNHEINMFTVVIVGNSKTYVKKGKMITPRGYKL
ncbi:MAG: precorrin-3B C(17)-methyltransferase [Psychrilyobacter sp.]|uniref:precorrin-3B C(17)-methyltransferase n=1 Tax=Psychrilyobacter sp. TaxID=2586924 RepID=UPI003C7072BA